VDQCVHVLDGGLIGRVVVDELTQQRVDEDDRRLVDQGRLLPARRQQVTVDRMQTRADGQ